MIALISKGIATGSVDHKDLKDARAIDPPPRDAGPRPRIVVREQLLGNVGRFAGGGASSGNSGGSGPRRRPEPDRGQP